MSLLVAISWWPLGLGWRWEQINVGETTSLGSVCSCSEVASELLLALILGALGCVARVKALSLLLQPPTPAGEAAMEPALCWLLSHLFQPGRGPS